MEASWNRRVTGTDQKFAIVISPGALKNFHFFVSKNILHYMGFLESLKHTLRNWYKDLCRHTLSIYQWNKKSNDWASNSVSIHRDKIIEINHYLYLLAPQKPEHWIVFCKSTCSQQQNLSLLNSNLMLLIGMYWSLLCVEMVHSSWILWKKKQVLSNVMSVMTVT